MDMKLEVVILPVSRTSTARSSSTRRSAGGEDADLVTSEDFRVIQLTPPGSPAAVIFGTGVTSAVPGSVGGLSSPSTTWRRRARSSPAAAST